ncbi:MAG: DUF4294 domain-containing protein [Bacteroidia bacterium]|nr:MAG: DUF4294 domain-containing protein [Bacteroidia bacterium]
MHFLYIIIIICFCTLAGGNPASAALQPPGDDPVYKDLPGTMSIARVMNGDTLIIIELQAVEVVADRSSRNRWQQYRYDRTVRNVKRVYPYAKLAGQLFTEYSREIMTLENERERRAYIGKVEDELLERFEDDLKRLTISQGLILIKLIDRETEHTTYDILREFRGVFSAVFWQSLGRLFGYNLKTEYDPDGEDRRIEEIVQLIEQGLL